MQGINHAYNLQGWLKTFNPDVQTGGGYTLKADGSTGSVVGKPAYQVMLNYFNGDYKAISGATPWNGATALGGDYRPLYNGNISSMAVDIEKLGNPLLYNYQYDQLNRLVTMDAWQKGSDWGSLTARSDFQERISYDANGNIIGYKRNGNTFAGSPLEMDSLNYNYVVGTNRLDHVSDNVTASNYSQDIDGQMAGNYDYDAIGDLIKDNAEGIVSISWTVHGKISRIFKNDGTNISYTYDPSGNRLSKTVATTSPASSETPWYVRDAQGNVLSLYESGKSSVNDGRLSQTELHLYGSNRLGLLRRSFDVTSEYNPAGTNLPLLGNGTDHIFARGNKLFEVNNHLGNVLVTLNDKKIGVSTNNSTVDYFDAQIVSAQDYYPFGMLQPGRSYNIGSYRYGFNGKEMDNEVKGDGMQYDYGFRIYDARLGRFLSVDPLQKQFPWLTPYQFSANSPILFIDLDGLEPKKHIYNWKHTYNWAKNDYADDGYTNYYTLDEKDSKSRPYIVRSRVIGSYPYSNTQFQYYNYEINDYDYFVPTGFVPDYVQHLKDLESLKEFGVACEKAVVLAATMWNVYLREIMSMSDVDISRDIDRHHTITTKDRVDQIHKEVEASPRLKGQVMTIVVADVEDQDGRKFRLVAVNSSTAQNEKLYDEIKSKLKSNEIPVPNMLGGDAHAEENLREFAKKIWVNN